MSRPRRNLGHAQSAGVGGEYRILAHNGVEFAEQGLLEFQLLWRGLDHKGAFGEIA
ncbi:hypothetical protein D3C83_263010 [compost metagenome]